MKHKQPQIIEDAKYIDDSDDEEIDEDEAFNSEDELMYGELFTKKKKKPLSSKKPSSKKTSYTKLKGPDSDSSDSESDGDNDDDSDDGSDSSGSDSDENDWAGSSDDDDEEDDGGAYMLDLLNNLDKQVTPGSSKNDKVTKKKGEGGKLALDTAASEAAVRLPESEFQAGALSAMSNTDGGASGGNKLTLDSLMGGISDTANFASVQKSMRALSSGVVGQAESKNKSSQKKLETTAVPVARVVSERASRKVHTEATSKEVSRWQDAVHEQRDAETLDFRTNKGGAATHRITRDALVEKYEPTNDFERELQDALEKAGMEDERRIARRERKRLTGDDDDGKELGDEDEDLREDDDLGRNHITMAEYKKRHGELAKLRALMFYEEQKRHHINKIKSKKYRKIRKRQRDRLKDAEDDNARLNGEEEAAALDREKAERDEMERMKERMTLAHKNTSNWAKRVLRRGAKMDNEERRALSLQIARGDELRRKQMGDGDDGSGSESETEEGLLQKARDILMEKQDDGDGGDEGNKKKKGLFQLEFMKRGMEAQRVRAKEEARKLLEELEANDIAASVSSSDSSDDEDGGKDNKSKKKPKVATEAETKKVLPEGKLVASSLKFGKADGFAIKVDGNIELDGNSSEVVVKPKELDNEDGEEQETTQGNKKKRKKKKNSAPTSEKANDTTPAKVEEDEAEEEENPWITTKSSSSTKKKSKKSLSTTVNINEAASMLADTNEHDNKGKRKQRENDSATTKPSEKETASNNDVSVPSEAAEKEVGVAELSQAELVRRAFAAPADLEAEEEFQKEKDLMKGRDDPTRKKKEEKTVSGWGSWAGAGAPPPRKKQRKLPPKLQAPTSKKTQNNVPKRKDDGLSTVIINEKRLKKTAQFQLSEIPYPYRSREEYERAIAGNIGQEWNTVQGTKDMSRPAVLVRAGKIIQPLATNVKNKKANKQRRAPAKF